MTRTESRSSRILIVDSSALCAILLLEEDAQIISRKLESAIFLRMSVASVVETSIVVLKRNPLSSSQAILSFLDAWNIEVVPVGLSMMQIAMDAYSRYGKGRHPARLNFGDCFSYALAKHWNEPLLFKGDDFSKTDIIAA